ncbi:hypothetical protein Fmac_025124 [Flemingia macrophylla]|uniref:Uncharacterized protein n=1 Tax=Flemingia macrophylla TaxID=520843 RepID=A0ABD1LRC1_9FABA
MKIIISALIVMLVLSVGIENEGPIKVIEGRSCEEKLYENTCEEKECNVACQKKHGNSATGHCNAIEDCICRFPC